MDAIFLIGRIMLVGAVLILFGIWTDVGAILVGLFTPHRC